MSQAEINAQNVIDEIMKSEPSIAYIKLQREIAEAKERLGATNGWFWKKPALSVGQRAEEEAKVKLMEIALQQVISTLACEGKGNIEININKKTINL